jgi:hypothetical protein
MDARVMQAELDEAICWGGGTAAQAKKHRRRGEKPCTACLAAERRAKEDREAKRNGR